MAITTTTADNIQQSLERMNQHQYSIMAPPPQLQELLRQIEQQNAILEEPLTDQRPAPAPQLKELIRQDEQKKHS